MDKHHNCKKQNHFASKYFKNEINKKSKEKEKEAKVDEIELTKTRDEHLSIY